MLRHVRAPIASFVQLAQLPCCGFQLARVCHFRLSFASSREANAMGSSLSLLKPSDPKQGDNGCNDGEKEAAALAAICDDEAAAMAAIRDEHYIDMLDR